MKIKNKNLSFSNQNWDKKLKSGKIRKKPEKSGNPKNDSENPNILTKNLSLFDRFSLAHSGGPSLEQSLILLNKSRSQALCSKCLSARPRG